MCKCCFHLRVFYSTVSMGDMNSAAGTKKTLSVTLPDGRVVTTKTARNYTHAVVCKHAERDGWIVCQWSSKPLPASAAALKPTQPWLTDKRVVEVSQ